MTPASVFHLAEPDAWAAAEASGGPYRPASFAGDGFVHCSTAAQVGPTAERWYPGRDDLVLLELDVAALGPALVFEPGSRGEDELFPHCYAPIPLAAVRAARPFGTGNRRAR